MLAAPLVASPVNLAATSAPVDVVETVLAPTAGAPTAPRSRPKRTAAISPVAREGRSGEGRGEAPVATRAAEPMLVSVDCVLDGCVVQSGLELTVVGSSGMGSSGVGSSGAGSDPAPDGAVGRRRATN